MHALCEYTIIKFCLNKKKEFRLLYEYIFYFTNNIQYNHYLAYLFNIIHEDDTFVTFFGISFDKSSAKVASTG